MWPTAAVEQQPLQNLVVLVPTSPCQFDSQDILEQSTSGLQCPTYGPGLALPGSLVLVAVITNKDTTRPQ